MYTSHYTTNTHVGASISLCLALKEKVPPKLHILTLICFLHIYHLAHFVKTVILLLNICLFELFLDWFSVCEMGISINLQNWEMGQMFTFI